MPRAARPPTYARRWPLAAGPPACAHRAPACLRSARCAPARAPLAARRGPLAAFRSPARAPLAARPPDSVPLAARRSPLGCPPTGRAPLEEAKLDIANAAAGGAPARRSIKDLIFGGADEEVRVLRSELRTAMQDKDCSRKAEDDLSVALPDVTMEAKQPQALKELKSLLAATSTACSTPASSTKIALAPDHGFDQRLQNGTPQSASQRWMTDKPRTPSSRRRYSIGEPGKLKGGFSQPARMGE